MAHHSAIDFPELAGLHVVPQERHISSAAFLRRGDVIFNQDDHLGIFLHDALARRNDRLAYREFRAETTTTSSKITVRLKVSPLF